MTALASGALSALVEWLLTYAIHSTLLLGGGGCWRGAACIVLRTSTSDEPMTTRFRAPAALRRIFGCGALALLGTAPALHAQGAALPETPAERRAAALPQAQCRRAGQ